jgi:LexA-binding, inner membrane-associated putative hydrolase
MDLPTHFVFAIAVGLVFFGRYDIALLMALGALIPDLDREYWFVRVKKYADEQYHRARFHNVFMLPAAYLLSPYLSLGVFLHILQDSFTTAKDRGVEWFYPLTRLVKRGLYDPSGNPEQKDPKQHVYFYQEDPHGLVNLADTDLREGPDPVPWRRVYGFAQNSHLLDRGFLFASLALVLIWLASPLTSPRVLSLVTYLSSNWTFVIPEFLWVGLFFGSGELDRYFKTKNLPTPRILKIPLFTLGAIAGIFWVWIIRDATITNLRVIFADPLPLIEALIVIPLVCILVILWQTRGGRDTMV